MSVRTSRHTKVKHPERRGRLLETVLGKTGGGGEVNVRAAQDTKTKRSARLRLLLLLRDEKGRH